jgi:hypothetical protein
MPAQKGFIGILEFFIDFDQENYRKLTKLTFLPNEFKINFTV